MSSSTLTATYVFRSPYIFSSQWSRITHSMINQWGVVWGHTGCEIFFAGVLIELFWCEIYSAKSMPYPGHQYGSCSCWGMWRQAPWIMQEYELVTMIAIWKLTQPRTCERIYWVLPPWVDSNVWVWQVPPSRACNLLIGQTEKKCFHCEW